MRNSRVVKIGIGGIVFVTAMAFAGVYVGDLEGGELPGSSLDTPDSQQASAKQWGNKEDLRALFADATATTTQETASTKTSSPKEQAKSGPEVNLSVEQVKKQLTQNYVNKKLGFAFKYPAGFRAGSFKSGPKSTNVLLQHPDKQVGLQVMVTNLDKEIDLTTRFIRQELPTYLLVNPQPVRIGGKQRGVVFKSKNQAFGESREIWFSRGKRLYQITSYASLDPFIKAVFETWQFQ